jgi:hypothetical protein
MCMFKSRMVMVDFETTDMSPVIGERIVHGYVWRSIGERRLRRSL